MYSGYYQHEVKANLVNAEKMFEAMGFTLLPNHTLILEGPICPDQVTNVSRDAMTAYVECQVDFDTDDLKRESKQQMVHYLFR